MGIQVTPHSLWKHFVICLITIYMPDSALAPRARPDVINAENDDCETEAAI